MRISKSTTIGSESALAAAVVAAKEAKQRLIEAQEAYDKAEHELVEFIRANEKKSAVADFGDKHVKATVVQRENVTVDESGLRKAIGAKLFDSFCVKKLDKTALKHGIADNLVDPVIVAQHSKVTMGKAYIIFSEPTEKEPDD